MLNGLAAWHYPHRTLIENIEYFTAQGYEAIGLLGSHFIDGIRADGEKLAAAMKASGKAFTNPSRYAASENSGIGTLNNPYSISLSGFHAFIYSSNISKVASNGFEICSFFLTFVPSRT